MKKWINWQRRLLREQMWTCMSSFQSQRGKAQFGGKYWQKSGSSIWIERLNEDICIKCRTKQEEAWKEETTEKNKTLWAEWELDTASWIALCVLLELEIDMKLREYIWWLDCRGQLNTKDILECGSTGDGREVIFRFLTVTETVTQEENQVKKKHWQLKTWRRQ